jgi:hypothetical protein
MPATRWWRWSALASASFSTSQGRGREMFRMTVRYARYALSALASVGFGANLN